MMFSQVRLLRRSLSQQHRPHRTRGQLASRHSLTRRMSSIAADRARQEKAENEHWAKQPGAREVLAQPPFDVDRKPDDVNPKDMCHSLEEYLKARRWHHPDGPARRFLSHLLTYPLTLAAGLHEVGLSYSAPNIGVSTPAGGRLVGVSGDGAVGTPAAGTPAVTETAAAEADGDGGGGHRVSVVCVGARAESTLPPGFWRETLFALPGVSHLSLYLVGPELGLPPGVASSATGGGHRGSSSSEGARGGQGRGCVPPIPDHPTAVVKIGDQTAEIRWIRAVLDKSAGKCAVVGNIEAKGLGASAASGAEVKATTAAAAAALASAESAMEGADAFVLFNPGLGHPHLREGWEGAVKRLLASGKPIIVSCHSREDLDRDERQLRAIGERWGFGGVEGGGGVDLFLRDNAFCSLMKSEDPVPSMAGAEDIVSSNWGLLLVHANRK